MLKTLGPTLRKVLLIEGRRARGPGWRLDPRSHNRLSRSPGRRAQDDVALDGVTSSFSADGVPNCNQT